MEKGNKKKNEKIWKGKHFVAKEKAKQFHSSRKIYHNDGDDDVLL